MAEFVFRDGLPGYSIENKKHTADLVIRERAAGHVVVRYENWLTNKSSVDPSP